MAAYGVNRAPASVKRPAVPAGDPILTSKITAPGVPPGAVHRPRLTELTATGTRCGPLTAVVPADRGDRSGWCGQDDGGGVVGGGRIWPGRVGRPGRVRQPAGRVLVL